MATVKKMLPGLLLSAALAVVATFTSGFIPHGVIGASVLALLLGMLLNPLLARFACFAGGIRFTSKIVLRTAIVLMGATLHFSQILQVGRYSLVVMCFTLLCAFGGGYLLGKLFGMNWKLSSLISAGTGICGGSAIAAIAPTIDAKDSDVAYAISATFIFDILMVILFPIAGRFFGMSDMGFGLWTGTAVNDTSSVVAAGYAFSDAAGAYSVIVKLTRTLSIIPAVLAFSAINQRVRKKQSAGAASGNPAQKKVRIRDIFPYFILLFLAVVVVKSLGIFPENVSQSVSAVSKFLMVMALGSIGLKTNFREIALSGWKPMLHGFIISALVVVVSFLVQLGMHQL